MTELVKAELNRLAAISNKKPSDYTINGILHCGKCDEPKQAWIDWLPDEEGNVEKKLVPVMCRCALEEEAREKEREAENRFLESQRYYQLTIHGQQPELSTAKFEEDAEPEKPISVTCRRYVKRWDEMRRDDMGILFYGSRGTGKSFYASCIVNELRKRRVVSVMTTTSNLSQQLSGTWDKAGIMEAIGRVPLLVLDDLGAERDTSYSAELLYNIVNSRYNSRLPIIVTTNIDLAEMRVESDLWRSRIYDRVIEMCPIAIRMDGESRRAGIADERKKKARELLKGDGI